MARRPEDRDGQRAILKRDLDEIAIIVDIQPAGRRGTHLRAGLSHVTLVSRVGNFLQPSVVVVAAVIHLRTGRENDLEGTVGKRGNIQLLGHQLGRGGRVESQRLWICGAAGKEPIVQELRHQAAVAKVQDNSRLRDLLESLLNQLRPLRGFSCPATLARRSSSLHPPKSGGIIG